MRSTRASAAWAGIALATSFLSVTIMGAQPRTNETTTAAVSTREGALGAMKSVDVVADGKLTVIHADRGSH